MVGVFVFLGDEEEVFADSGLLLEPGFEVGFGLVGGGGVEGANTLAVGVAEQAGDAASATGADIEEGDLDAGFAEGAFGEGGGCFLSVGLGEGQAGGGAGRDEGSGLQEGASIGVGGVCWGHGRRVLSGFREMGMPVGRRGLMCRGRAHVQATSVWGWLQSWVGFVDRSGDGGRCPPYGTVSERGEGGKVESCKWMAPRLVACREPVSEGDGILSDTARLAAGQ